MTFGRNVGAGVAGPTTPVSTLGQLSLQARARSLHREACSCQLSLRARASFGMRSGLAESGHEAHSTSKVCASNATRAWLVRAQTFSLASSSPSSAKQCCRWAINSASLRRNRCAARPVRSAGSPTRPLRHAVRAPRSDAATGRRKASPSSLLLPRPPRSTNPSPDLVCIELNRVLPAQ